MRTEKYIAAVKTIFYIKNFWIPFFDYFHILPDKVVEIRLRNGIRLFGRTNTADLATIAATHFIHDYPTSILYDIPKNATVLDFGGHIGAPAVMLAKMRPDLHIYSIEPIKENFELLEKNIQANKMEKKITAINAAATDFDGICYLNDVGGTDAYYVNHEKKKEKGIKCKAITIASILKKYKIKPDSVKFIKMNIEGEEYKIIDDLVKNIKKPEYVFMEYHIVINNVVKFPDGDKVLAKKMKRIGMDIMKQTDHSLLFSRV